MSTPPIFGSTPFSFGAANTSNANANTNQPAPGTTGGQPSLFGAPAAGTPGGTFGGFGVPAAGAQQPKPVFGFGTGSTATATQPATTSATPAAPAGGGLFGSSTTFGAPTGSSNLFGNAAKPAGTDKPATTSLFGAPATGAPTNLFGGGTLFGAKPATGPPTPAAGTPGATAPVSIAAPTFGLFGNAPKPPEASSTGSAPAPSLFGGFGKPASSTPAPLFGNPPPAPGIGGSVAVAAAPTTAAPSLFGPSAGTAPVAAPAASAGGLFGGFGAAPKEKEKEKEPQKDAPKDGAAKPAETAAATTAPVPNLFGGFGLTKPASAAAPAVPLFGGLSAPTTSTSSQAAKPAVPLFGAPPGKATEQTAATNAQTSKPTSSNITTTTITPAVATSQPPTAAAAAIEKPAAAPLIPPSILKGKTLEDIVNQWDADLETQAKEFQRLAGEVEVWDRVLNDNAKQIANVYALVLQAETTQANVEASLDQIEIQQKQVAENLESFVQVVDEQQGLDVDIGPADAERDKNYTLATSLNTQMDELARSLSTMIDEVNSVTAPAHSGAKTAENVSSLANSASQKRELLDEDLDPMAQIQGILNAHLESLTWINSTVKELESKVGGLETKFGNVLPDQPTFDRGSVPRSGSRGLLLQRGLDSSVGPGVSRFGSSVYGFSR